MPKKRLQVSWKSDMSNRFSDETKEDAMSRVCEICGKGPMVGYNVSHAHNKTKKVWYPNLQKIRVVVNGRVKRMKVCTRCIRSGRVTKPSALKG